MTHDQAASLSDLQVAASDYESVTVVNVTRTPSQCPSQVTQAGSLSDHISDDAIMMVLKPECKVTVLAVRDRAAS